MARRGRRRGSRTRTITRYARRGARRVGRRSKGELKRYGMKALKGAAIGLPIAVGLGIAARYLNQPVLFEVGERAGSVAAAWAGGPVGNAAFQMADAVVERVIPSTLNIQGGGISRITEGYL